MVRTGMVCDPQIRQDIAGRQLGHCLLHGAGPVAEPPLEVPIQPVLGTRGMCLMPISA
jgi:hypothetical protein